MSCCLACDAARRDALDLFRAVVDDSDLGSPRVKQLVSGMDKERGWRTALFLAGIAGGLANSFADAFGLAPAEVVQIFTDELTGDHRDHPA